MMKSSNQLRVLAISAPHWISKAAISKNSYSFNSQTPFSLQNALRDAAEKARTGFSKEWSNSNFKSFKSRNEAILLLEYWEEQKDIFEKLFEKINPNLLLIGAMTLSFPGAIEIAKYAKSKKGSDIFVVLGGKHCNETVFKSRKDLVLNHLGSPLKLMLENTIPRVFDLVISGDGEKIITKIGEVIGSLAEKKASFSNFFNGKNIRKLQTSQGNWIAGHINNHQIIYHQSEKNNNIDYGSLAYTINLFEIKKGFQIFGTDLTAHAYSDSSRGCGYDCFFCSERASINGKLRIKDNTSVNRLFQQFNKLKKVKQKRYKNQSISIFIEDSIALTGKPEFLNEFANRCIKNNIYFKFGMQFTVDTFLSLETYIIDKLVRTGLDYVAFGIETIDNEIAKSFSKNTNKNKGWVEKTEAIIVLCNKFNIKCGMFLIWGLGETQENRISQLLQVLNWIKVYNVPIDIGLNIATQHPMQIVNDTHLDKHGYKKYDYIDWGTPKNDDYLPYFIELFGEASTKYAINKNELPKISELEELKKLYLSVKKQTYSML